MDDIKIRNSKPGDITFLVQWFLEPGTLKWFPMKYRAEVEDAARNCLFYARYNAAWTATYKNVPCGFINLYLQPFQKLSHQCLFPIIVTSKFRGKGIGSKLIKHAINEGKNKFKLEYLHLEVYQGNPAKALYEKLGFVQYGVHKRFIKDGDEYLDNHLMQKKL